MNRRNTQHGESIRGGTKEWRAWTGMHKRCQGSRYYKGRVFVCERWSDFPAFLEDVGRAPSLAHELDRIDNEKGYEPGNVRWATHAEQMWNRRSLIGRSKFKGVYWNKQRRKWHARIYKEGVRHDLGFFTDESEAAKEYDAAAKRLFGQFAAPNFKETR